MSYMNSPRRIVWFSCGAASAVTAKLTVHKYPGTEVVYCDTSDEEHPDNLRFRRDVEKWIEQPVTVIKSKEYTSISDVFRKRRYMSGISGAICTAQMKKVPRFEFQRPDDIHLFGFTADEPKRIRDFQANNFELLLEWPLRDMGITKDEVYEWITAAGIELPVMYKLGYRNNNCIGCVKATSPGYWAKIRKDFPKWFNLRAKQSREIGCRLVRLKGKRIFLDELPEGDFKFKYRKENLSCGPECKGVQTS